MSALLNCSACRRPRPAYELLRVTRRDGRHPARLVCRPSVDYKPFTCFSTLGPASVEAIAPADPITAPRPPAAVVHEEDTRA